MPEFNSYKILADENFRVDVAQSLRKLGCDLKYARKGIKNGELFAFAVEEKRILLTHDQDFADPKRYPPEKTGGIVIIKVHPPIPEKILMALENLFQETPSKNMAGRLFIVTEENPRTL